MSSNTVPQMVLALGALFTFGSVGCFVGKTIVSSKPNKDEDPSVKRDVAILEGVSGMCFSLLIFCILYMNFKTTQ